MLIRHAKNGYEHRIGNYKLDGYCNGIGYEFHGCLFHGCLKCFSPRSYNPFKKETMQDTYKKHLKRIEEIKKEIQLIEIWECDWDLQIQNNNNLKEFVKSQKIRDC